MARELFALLVPSGAVSVLVASRDAVAGANGTFGFFFVLKDQVMSFAGFVEIDMAMFQHMKGAA